MQVQYKKNSAQATQVLTIACNTDTVQLVSSPTHLQLSSKDIQKAFSSLQITAQTSDAHHPTSTPPSLPNMSLPTPKEILNRFYAAEAIYMATPDATRDPTDMLSTLSPNLNCVQSPDLPWGGDYVGHADFSRWGEIMKSYFDSLEVLEPRFFESDDPNGDEVLVYLKLRLVVKGSGEVVESPMTQVVTVDREKGVVLEIRPFYWNVAGLRKALGL